MYTTVAGEGGMGQEGLEKAPDFLNEPFQNMLEIL